MEEIKNDSNLNPINFGLMVGNSRLHWALFENGKLCQTWDTNYLSPENIQTLMDYPSLSDFLNFFHTKIIVSAQEVKFFEYITNLSLKKTNNSNSPYPVKLASVVPSQTSLWEKYKNVKLITLENLPFQGIYETLGIDRALALYGAGQAFGFPMMVIDTGTALTFTCADHSYNFVGGAILPGLGLQISSLNQKTGLLPKIEIPKTLPPRFALNTVEAMQSGVIYTLIAGVRDFIKAWWHQFPDGKVAITGGDRVLIKKYLQSHDLEIGDRLLVEKDLIFWGMVNG
jgi:type III pantothenate kinase